MFKDAGLGGNGNEHGVARTPCRGRTKPQDNVEGGGKTKKTRRYAAGFVDDEAGTLPSLQAPRRRLLFVYDR